MYIEDVLQLIGINATTDQIAKLIELLNKVGVYPASRTVTPPVQVSSTHLPNPQRVNLANSRSNEH